MGDAMASSALMMVVNAARNGFFYGVKVSERRRPYRSLAAAPTERCQMAGRGRPLRNQPALLGSRLAILLGSDLYGRVAVNLHGWVAVKKQNCTGMGGWQWICVGGWQ